MGIGKKLADKAFSNIEVYKAHAANIHERRAAAVSFRGLPLVVFIAGVVLSIYGGFWFQPILLIGCAFLNTSLWVYMVSSAIFCLWGIRKVASVMDEVEKIRRDKPADGHEDSGARSSTDIVDVESASGITHMIVFPNYKEDEEMLAQTLHSLSEAEGAEDFRVVMGMEAREGPDGEAKAERLKARFSKSFKWILISLHPKDLTEVHNDGSEDAEVPGKASNLKWAVVQGYEALKKEPSVKLDDVVVTVADADVIFHPCYFYEVTKDYTNKECTEMRARGRSEQIYRMWQCPQLPFRNYYLAPVCSRSWGYLATVDEFGGIASLSFGGHHMVFSGYSIPLMLGMEAQPWDADIVAEDHHAFLRCFYYSIHAQAKQLVNDGRITTPVVATRPIFLPAKSTSCASEDGYWASCVERYHQARRHMQGVSEVGYALLATWDTLRTLPWSMALSPSLHLKMCRVLTKLCCLHLLPVLQTIFLGVLSFVWILHRKRVPQCPASLSMADTNSEMILCGLAGAWVLTWPVVVPMFFFVVANYLFMIVFFVQARKNYKPSIWHREDGMAPPTLGSCRLTILLMCVVDICVFMMIVSVPYALIPEIFAYWYVTWWGNRIKYITASKAMAQPAAGGGGGGYGTLLPAKSA